MMGMRKTALCILSCAALTAFAGEAVYAPVVENVFKAKNGKIREWREDDWCKGVLKFRDGSPLKTECVGKSSVLIHSKRFGVTPGETLKGTFQAAGDANVAFALYLYDEKGFAGVQCPRFLKEKIGMETPYNFSIWVPDRLNGRVPKSASLALDFRKGSNLELQKITLSHKVEPEMILKSGKLTVELDKKTSNIAAIRLGESDNLIRSFGFSWYAKGLWRNEEIEPDPVVVEQKTDSMLKMKGGCRDFSVEKTFTLLSSPEAVRIDFKLTAKEDFIIGGGDPPGGIELPRIVRIPRLTHYLKVNGDGSTKVLGNKDFKQYETGFFPEDYIAGVCSPDGREGYFYLIDSRFYANCDQAPFILGTGLCYSRDAFRFLKKGDAITGQLYLIPFSGNPEKIAGEAVKAYCSANPAERAVNNERYANYLKQAPSTFRKFVGTSHFDLYGGGSELVLPQQKLPAEKGNVLKFSAARNENGYTQIVIRPKNGLNSVEVAADAPEGTALEVNYLESAPSRYAATALGIRGEIPDILAPAKQRTLSANRNHSYLLTFSVGKDAKPGIRKGTIRIKEAGTLAASIPYELEIHDFALPVTPFYRTAFLVWTTRAYAKNFNKQSYLKDHRKLRITAPVEIVTPCDGKGNISAGDLKGIQRQVKAALDAGDTCYRFPATFDWRGMPLKDKTSPEAEAYIKNYIRQIAGSMREIGALKQAWILMMDETHWGDAANNRHIQWCKWVKEAAPDLPLFSTQNHPLIPLAGAVDIACGSNSSMKVLRDRFGDQKEYWLYENGFYFALGQSGLVPRSLPWRSHAGKFAGYHQWSSTFWNKGFEPGTFHGTGAFYYPPEFGDGKPVRSFRLVNFSQGVGDYDYIRLLEKEIERCRNSSDGNAVKEAGKAAGALSGLLKEIVPDQYTFNADTAKIQDARRVMAHWIVKLKQCP